MLIRVCDRCSAVIVASAAAYVVGLDTTLPATKQGQVTVEVDLVELAPVLQTPAGPGAPNADLCPLCLASALVVLAVQLGTANGMKPKQAQRLAQLFDPLVNPVVVAPAGGA